MGSPFLYPFLKPLDLINDPGTKIGMEYGR